MIWSLLTEQRYTILGCSRKLETSAFLLLMNNRYVLIEFSMDTPYRDIHKRVEQYFDVRDYPVIASY